MNEWSISKLLWDIKDDSLLKSGFVSCVLDNAFENVVSSFTHHPIVKSNWMTLLLEWSLIQMHSINKAQTQWGTFHRASPRARAWSLAPSEAEIEVNKTFTHTDCIIHIDLLFTKLLHVHHLIWSSQWPYNSDAVGSLTPLNRCRIYSSERSVICPKSHSNPKGTLNLCGPFLLSSSKQDTDL